MARSRYKFVENDHIYFVTATIVNWLPIFANPAFAQIVIDSLAFLQAQRRLELFAYVILENHLHLVASAYDLSKQMANFKSYTARQIIDSLQSSQATAVLRQLAEGKRDHKWDRPFQLWQEGSHPQIILGEAMMQQKVAYVHQNPVRRGYVDEPVHWRYSSARNYMGLESLIAVNTEWG